MVFEGITAAEPVLNNDTLPSVFYSTLAKLAHPWSLNLRLRPKYSQAYFDQLEHQYPERYHLASNPTDMRRK